MLHDHPSISLNQNYAEQFGGVPLDTQRHKPILNWRRAHEELSRLAKCRARIDWEEGRGMLAAFRSGAHLHLGFGSFGEYVERLFGYGRRSTEERLRVAEALEHLPTLGQALREGEVSWSSVRELTRVATEANEHAWLEVAKGRTMRQVEELVARHKPGDGPEDDADDAIRRHVLRFVVAAETLATFREAMAKLRQDAGARLDDDALLLLLARRVLGGPVDEGRAAYQIALTVCEACKRGWQDGRGERVDVGSEIVEMARCDGQHLGRVGRAGEVSGAHVGARLTRARQDVPPAVRRSVMRRDGGKCVVPGCRHGVFVDIHHLKPRAEGGDHDPDGLAVLCAAHHRALHRGQLVLEGRISTGLTFRHADGTEYGATPNPDQSGTFEQAFRALRSLEFRETDVRRVLGRVWTDPRVGEWSVVDIVRQALPSLTS